MWLLTQTPEGKVPPPTKCQDVFFFFPPSPTRHRHTRVSFFYQKIGSRQVQDYSAPWRFGSLAVLLFRGMAVLNDPRSAATHLQDICHRAASVFITQPPSLAAPAPSSLKPHHSVVFPPLHPCSTHFLRLTASSFSLLWSRRLQPPSGSTTTRRESQMYSRNCSFFFFPTCFFFLHCKKAKFSLGWKCR